MTRIIGTFVLLSCFCCAAAPANQDDDDVNPSFSALSGPWCGVYSLYTALKIEGVQTRLNDLLRHEYISTPDGSTLEDLRLAAEVSGLHAELVRNLDVEALRQLGCPVLLHVKDGLDSVDYDHFVLCVAFHNGQLALFDPPNTINHIVGHELAPIWDGTGLAVSRSPISLKRIDALALAKFVTKTAAVIAIVILLKRLRKRRGYPDKAVRPRAVKASIVESGWVFAIAIFLAALYHCTDAEGFLAQRHAVAELVHAQAVSFATILNASEVRKLGNTGVIVDARNTSDYSAGHLPNAINVPPGSNHSERTRAMAGISKDAKIIIYCQNESCRYKELVARRLWTDGFGNLSLFPGGWDEWASRR